MAYQEFDMDLEQIVETLFSSSDAPPPNKYQIIFDPDEIPADVKPGLYIFEQMIMIFVKGLQIRYKKESISVDEISPEEFWYIQQYFKGLGITLNCDIEPILDETKVDAFLNETEIYDDELPSLTNANDVHVRHRGNISQVRQYENTNGEKLKDYYFLLSSTEKRYKISFDYFVA